VHGLFQRFQAVTFAVRFFTILKGLWVKEEETASASMLH
jgi:hypothetical protein